VKTFALEPAGADLSAAYSETVSGPLFVRVGLSPNPLDLIHSGQANLVSSLLGDRYRLRNTLGAGAQIEWPAGVAFNASPSWAGADRRNLALTEEVELSGDGAFTLLVRLRPDTAFTPAPPVSAPAVPSRAGLRLGPSPVRAGGVATLAFTLERAADVRMDVLDAGGRRVRGEALGTRAAGEHAWTLAARDAWGRALAPGLYFVRVTAGERRAEARWVVME
jgi:hypothetical protein